MTERDVTTQITDFLRYRGWRLIRMNSGLFKHAQPGYKGRVRVGEPGMADWLCIRYWPKHQQVFWLEIKATGKGTSKGQRQWIEYEIFAGATVCITDSLESFEAWYLERP